MPGRYPRRAPVMILVPNDHERASGQRDHGRRAEGKAGLGDNLAEASELAEAFEPAAECWFAHVGIGRLASSTYTRSGPRCAVTSEGSSFSA
jgi:hypothetical protein